MLPCCSPLVSCPQPVVLAEAAAGSEFHRWWGCPGSHSERQMVSVLWSLAVPYQMWAYNGGARYLRTPSTMLANLLSSCEV